MKVYRLTLERHDNTWGQYVFMADDMQSALRYIARSVDLGRSKNAHFVEVERDENADD